MAAKMFIDCGGLKMPALGLGTWQCTDEKELKTSLNYALELGYRHIDTAFIYQNEPIIASVINSWISSGRLKREDLFIVTKLPLTAVHPDRVETYMKKSLDNLKLDYVDLYLIHMPTCMKIPEGGSFMDMVPEVTDLVEVWKKMEEQVDAGRTKTIGLSNFNIRQIDRILKNARIKPANLQVELHVYLQQRELVKFCHDNGISVVAYSPLGSPGYNQVMVTLGLEGEKLPNMLGDPIIKEIAKKHNKTTAQIMLRHLLQRNIAAIPKSVKVSRLKENINIFNFVLDDDDMKRLNDLEVGEAARIATLSQIPAILNHPENPLKG